MDITHQSGVGPPPVGMGGMDPNQRYIPPPTSDRPLKRPKLIKSGSMPHRPPEKMKKKKSLSPPSPSSSSIGGDGKAKKKGKGGSSCHQCKSRRNFTALTYCTSNLDNKKKNCRKKFCEHCLKKFYKESPHNIPDKSNWKCPSCRKICCCAACRRRKMKDAGQLPPEDEENKGSKKSSGKPSSGMVPPRPTSHMIQKKQHHSSSMHMDKKPTKSSMKSSQEKHRSTRHPFFDTVIYTHESSDSDTDSSEEESSLDDDCSPEAMQRHNEQLAFFFAISQTPRVKKHISYIIERKDITSEQKVETIANLLRSSLSFSNIG